MMEFTKSIPGQNYSATISLTDNVLVLKICGVDEKYEKKFVENFQIWRISSITLVCV